MAIFIKSIETTELSKRMRVIIGEASKEVIYSELTGDDITTFDSLFNMHGSHFMCAIPDYTEHMQVLIISPDPVNINDCVAENYADMTQDDKDKIDNFYNMVDSL